MNEAARYLLDDPRLAHQVNVDVWDLAQQAIKSREPSLGSTDSFALASAVERYATRLMEWMVEGAVDDEPQPTAHGQRTMGPVLQSRVRSSVARRVEEHLARAESGCADLRELGLPLSDQEPQEAAEDIAEILDAR